MHATFATTAFRQVSHKRSLNATVNTLNVRKSGDVTFQFVVPYFACSVNIAIIKLFYEMCHLKTFENGDLRNYSFHVQAAGTDRK